MSSDTDSPTPVEKLINAASEWPEITVGPHRFNAVEFLLADHEIGHVHRGGGMLDVNFPKRMRDVLVEEGHTGDHHFAPNTGWTSYRVRTDADVDGGLWLLRVAYLYRALTQRRKPAGQAVLAEVDVAAELNDLGVDDEIRSLFENVVELNSLQN
jgi:hypothetical protein